MVDNVVGKLEEAELTNGPMKEVAETLGELYSLLEDAGLPSVQVESFVALVFTEAVSSYYSERWRYETLWDAILGDLGLKLAPARVIHTDQAGQETEEAAR